MKKAQKVILLTNLFRPKRRWKCFKEKTRSWEKNIKKILRSNKRNYKKNNKKKLKRKNEFYFYITVKKKDSKPFYPLSFLPDTYPFFTLKLSFFIYLRIYFRSLPMLLTLQPLTVIYIPIRPKEHPLSVRDIFLIISFILPSIGPYKNPPPVLLALI